jgi:endonuclease/exonuclease/phosphatase family metal-dependent hydrolase
MRQLRVATYNTRGFRDDPRLAARVVRAIAPDILCLQEVPRGLGAGVRTARFARYCGMSWTGHHRGTGGTTIATAPEIDVLDVRHVGLPVRWSDQARGYAWVRLTVPDGRVLTVVSIHLGLRAPERVTHVRSVLDALATHRPLVVAGDLNEGERGGAWHLLDQPDRLRLVAPQTATFPARAPHHRIDAIFASPELRSLPHREVSVPDAVWARASDHRPAWVDLALPTGAAAP